MPLLVAIVIILVAVGAYFFVRWILGLRADAKGARQATDLIMRDAVADVHKALEDMRSTAGDVKVDKAVRVLNILVQEYNRRQR